MNAQQEKIVKEFEATWQRAVGAYGVNIKPELEINNKEMQRVGDARIRSNGTSIIRIFDKSVAMFGWDEVINTIRHEVAHVVAFFLGEKGGHGKIWLKVAKSLGCDGKVSCKVRMQAIAQGTNKQNIFHCGCRNHLVSARMRNNILLRGERYNCKVCGITISQGALETA
jgi:predicted SprT family Zn-dependent metalloprotease